MMMSAVAVMAQADAPSDAGTPAGNIAVKSDAVGDVLRFVPLASVYVMKGCGLESASSWKRLAVNSATSLAASAAVTYGMKYTIDSDRPNHARHGLPSGHTMMAFCGATILYKEYGHLSPWLSVAGFSIATATAFCRVHRDHHTWWQAGTGAVVGMLGTELGYWIGDKLTGEHSQFAVGASPEGLSLAVFF